MMKRHVIYLLILASVTVPLFLPLGLKHSITPEVKSFYDAVGRLSPDSAVVVSFDFEASTIAETKPLALAILRHLFSRGVKVVSLSMLAEGAGLGYDFLNQTASESGKEYGTDYIFLGFRPQPQATILGLGEGLSNVFPQDFLGNEVSSLPLAQRVSGLTQVQAIISIADGDLPQYWVDYGQTRFKKPVLAAVTAAMATSYYSYLSSGQLSGLVGGLKGAAEYENLIHNPGMGNKGMEAQSIAHVMIIALIILGNLTYLKSRRGA